jgi:hypothetical protein
VTGTVVDLLVEDGGAQIADVKLVSNPGNLYRKPFARVECNPNVEVGDLLAFDVLPFCIAGNQEILRATNPVVLEKRDGSASDAEAWLHDCRS